MRFLVYAYYMHFGYWTYILVKIVTVCTVVQHCCKGDSPCQWNTPIFRPSEIRNP